MKILLLAYECSPYRGSEWAVGWGRMLGAAKIAETHVVTSEANYAALERARMEGLLPANVQCYTPVPDARLRRLEKKPVLFAYNYKAYHHWQRLARALIVELHSREQFQLVHQVNVCTFREPGYGHVLPIPFLWGPVGGTQNFPATFLPMLSPMEGVKEGVRSVANRLALHKPRVQRAARRAGEVLAANTTNARDFARAFGRTPIHMLETGLQTVGEPDRARFFKRREAARTGERLPQLRLLWSGELQTRKALPVLLRALARVAPRIDWQLDVLGEGPMRARWEAETARLGLQSRVRFRGRLPFAEATEAMHAVDLFCFSSLRDTSGNVVLEALSAGVPVVCFDHQGVGDMVTTACGVKLPVRSPRQAYRDWATTIERLANDPEALLQLSYGATVQARKFLWEDNHRALNTIYRRVLASGNMAGQQLERPGVRNGAPPTEASVATQVGAL